MSVRTFFTVKIRVSKTVLLLLIFFTPFIIILNSKKNIKNNLKRNDVQVNLQSLDLHKLIVDQYYQNRQSRKFSKLSAALFNNQGYPVVSQSKQNKTFLILIWKHYKFLEKRHIFYFGKIRHDPLEGCSVTNCAFTGDDDQLRTADAVLVHLQRGLWPRVATRKRSQRWIFLNDESPNNVFSLSYRSINYTELHNIFNWSMTYLSESDVPMPYGRTVPLASPKFVSDYPAEVIPNWHHKQRDVPVAILFSDCTSFRIEFVEHLKEYVYVDVHGNCGEEQLRQGCPDHECNVLVKYLFYLVLENSNCKEFMTEKLFYNAYYRGAIPIILGPSLKECETFLPPHSYLHVDNYPRVKDLAEAIMNISKDDNQLLKFHWWRNHFKIVNEHGYFGSKSLYLCRVCEALNYNDDKESVYSRKDLSRFLDSEMLCRENYD